MRWSLSADVEHLDGFRLPLTVNIDSSSRRHAARREVRVGLPGLNAEIEVKGEKGRASCTDGTRNPPCWPCCAGPACMACRYPFG